MLAGGPMRGSMPVRCPMDDCIRARAWPAERGYHHKPVPVTCLFRGETHSQGLSLETEIRMVRLAMACTARGGPENLVWAQ